MTLSTWLRRALLVSAIGLVTSAAHATEGVLEEPVIDLATLDLTVPESPAFTVMGLTPENVVRPTSPRNLAVALLNGVDRNGNLQSGIAIDTTPYLVWQSQTLTLARYQERSVAGYLRRVLARTQLSLATAKGTTDDDEAVRLGLGLRVTLWDDGDPRLDPELIARVLAVQQSVLGRLGQLRPWDDTILSGFGDAQTKFGAFVEMPSDERRRKIRALAPAGVQSLVLSLDLCSTEPRDTEILNRTLRETVGVADEAQLFAALGEPKEKLCSLDDDLRAAELALLLGAGARESAKMLSQTFADNFIASVEQPVVETLGWANREVERWRTEARQRNWNASAWEVGGAPSWTSTSGTIDDLDSEGGALWTSLAINPRLPVLNEVFSEYAASHSQAIFHLRYRIHQEIPDPNDEGAFFEQDDLLIGGRIRIGYEKFALSFDGAFVHADPEKGKTDDSAQFSVGADIRLTKDLWLNLSFGGQDGRNHGGDEAFVLSSLKYGFSSEPSFAAP